MSESMFNNDGTYNSPGIVLHDAAVALLSSLARQSLEKWHSLDEINEILCDAVDDTIIDIALIPDAGGAS